MKSAVVFMLIILTHQNIITLADAMNSSISTMPIPDDMAPVGGIDNIIYSILDGDRAMLNDYIQIMSEIFSADIFKEHLKFLSDIRLKCLPKIYFRLRKIGPSDFTNCQKLHNNLLNVFGGRMLNACKKSDTFLNCLTNAKNSLKKEYDSIEEDIVELYLNEIIDGKNTCMSDLIQQLGIFKNLVKKECK